MPKSAQGLCGNALPWEEVGAIRSIPEGDEYAGTFVIYPLQGMERLSGCPRVAAGPQSLAALSIPFRERDASLTNLEDSKRSIYFKCATRTSPKKLKNVLSCIESKISTPTPVGDRLPR